MKHYKYSFIAFLILSGCFNPDIVSAQQINNPTSPVTTTYRVEDYNIKPGKQELDLFRS